MKKFNINVILFVFAAVFVFAGIWGECFTRLKQETRDMLAGVRHLDAEAVLDAKDRIDKVSSEDLSYHDLMMEVDSFRNNLLGTRVVKKDDTTVVKALSDSLCEPVSRLDDREIKEVIDRIQLLKDVAVENGAQFLYCAAPRKEIYEMLPPNADNYLEENFDRLTAGLCAADIPVLDLREAYEENELTTGTDIFYYTDHHWRSKTAFLAASAICKELAARYGFECDAQKMDLENYTVSLYSDWFLGSKGKKVGRFFSWHGIDDFELIIPNFETDMTEEQPMKDETREGSFEETVLFMQNLEKDYYHKNTYTTYSGGDFRLQIMRNNLKPEGKKILLVRDSYGCAAAPFLSLQAGELHVCDVRNFEHFVGEKLNLETYIKEIKPDYVLVLYSGAYSVENGHGNYDFF